MALRGEAAHLFAKAIVARLARMRNAEGDHGVFDARLVADADRLAVQERAAALLGPEHLAKHRQVDHAGQHLVAARQRDARAEQRRAPEEVGGAVERIDEPGEIGMLAADAAALLAVEGVVRREARSSIALIVASARRSAWLTKSGPTLFVHAELRAHAREVLHQALARRARGFGHGGEKRAHQSRNFARHSVAASSMETIDEPIQNQITGPKS